MKTTTVPIAFGVDLASGTDTQNIFIRKGLKIYLAGPMTGLPDLNFPEFNRVTAALRATGHTVVNPVEINGDPTAEWTDCMRADIRELVTCQVIALLPGWQASRGAKLEFKIATSLAMPAFDAHELAGNALEAYDKNSNFACKDKLSPQIRHLKFKAILPEDYGQDPLQGAVDWLVHCCSDLSVTEIQAQLHIGYNRAKQLLDVAKQQETKS